MSEEPQKVTSEAGDLESSSDNVSGRVKWFNNKAGYGFITVTSGSQTNTDVFVHHSAICVNQEQYRYLVQGEYVQFELCQVENNDHKWQAGKVKGIDNGKLMCETRLENRQVRAENSTSDNSSRRAISSNKSRDDGRQYVVRSRGSGPREGEGDEWMLVRRRADGRNTSRPDVLRSRGPPRTNDNY